MRNLVVMCAVVGGLSGAAYGLTPDEVVVIYNSRSADSAAVAQFYMRARGIPASHLVPIACEPGERIAEDVYRLAVLPALQQVLHERKLDVPGAVKCLVTTYDVPLIINDVKVGAGDAATAARLSHEVEVMMGELGKATAAYDEIGRAGAMGAHAEAAASGKDALPEVVRQLNGAASSAAQRVMQLPGDERGKAMKALETVQEEVAGMAGVASLREAIARTAMSAAADKGVAEARAQLEAYQQQYADLQKMNTPAGQSGMVEIRKHTEGLIGAVQELMAQMALLTPAESEACFDSELSLCLAADQRYPRQRWLLNPNNLETWPRVKEMADVPRTLMVCRVDGATPAAAMDLVNRGLKAEKKGLEGKLYLDARGLWGEGAYAAFDADIRAAAAWVKGHATIDVVLDDTPELLEAKNCPDAALYCGWYSLHRFHESCQFVEGAVAYHVASFEMPTIRNAQDSGWVPQLLQKPIGGTLGAVSEPYLTAFAKPSQFFPLLLSGEFTQGEVWELTNPWLSWRIGYVGDPLYNPFKAHPKVGAEALRADPVLKNAWAILGR